MFLQRKHLSITTIIVLGSVIPERGMTVYVAPTI